jgi:hypothetical protein
MSLASSEGSKETLARQGRRPLGRPNALRVHLNYWIAARNHQRVEGLLALLEVERCATQADRVLVFTFLVGAGYLSPLLSPMLSTLPSNPALTPALILFSPLLTARFRGDIGRCWALFERFLACEGRITVCFPFPPHLLSCLLLSS